MDDFDTKLSTTYESALKSGHLIFTASETHFSKETKYDIECQICYAPALAKKPQGALTEQKHGVDTPKPTEDKPNPFLPHDPALYVTDASEEHKILLNKFCIVPRHFLVVTKEFQHQTTPLSPEDMLAVWGTLKALKNSKDAVAFFNCGARAGASQRHKHMQVIPLDHPSPISVLVRECSKRQRGKKENRPGDVFSVPFNCINGVTLLHDPSTTHKSQEDILLEAYITLMDAMHMALREYAEQEDLPAEELEIVNSKLSYNWILTTEFMMMVPRKQEKSDPVDGVFLNINSLGFAGMVLAKTEEESKLVKDKGGVMEVVSETGFSFGYKDRDPEQEETKKEQQAIVEKQMGSAFSNL